MNIELVSNNINNIIRTSLQKGQSLDSIILDLHTRTINITKILSKENKDLTYLCDIPLKEIKLDEVDISTRGLYSLYFINVSKNRIDDLFWIKNNSSKFPKKTIIQLNILLEFKEKLKRNSIKL